MNPKRKTVLIVDDDEGMRDTIAAILRRDFRVLKAGTGEAALAVMDKEDIDLLVLDVRLPGIDGFEVLKILQENYPFVEVIMISAMQEVESAVRAIKHGAYHYVTKDFDYESMRSLVNKASERQDLNRQVMMLSAEVAEQTEREFIVGPSKATRDIVDLARKVAKISATVLILGESGTGKELLARMIHREAGDSNTPFVAVNLAAIPKDLVESALFGHEKGAFTGAVRQQIGKFELASGGTLFLDEIGDLRLELQAKLLRAIQEGEIERVGGLHPIKTEFRLIAATNIDLDRAVKEGTFRGDLYYRLNVIPIRMPPLRERIEDLPELAKFFLRRYNIKFRKSIHGIADSTIKVLQSVLVAGKHPGAREPDRTARRRHRQALDHRRRPALRAARGAARSRGTGRREPARPRAVDIRAELPRPRARKIGLERDCNRTDTRHPAEHAEVQDGPARHP